MKECYAHLALADPSFHTPSTIDVLLSGDVYLLIMDGRKVVIDETLPAAFSSIFEWILIGPILLSKVSSLSSSPIVLAASIESLMDRFWQVEEPDVAPVAFTDDGRYEEFFQSECVRLPSGRFSVPMPFQTPSQSNMFAGSREVALKRFESLERKLSTDSNLKSLYVKFMSDYLTLGHMSVAETPGCYFIPHHAVYRPDDGASKIRVVFDASARCHNGSSLNDCLLTGPKLQQDITDILTRFRIYHHAFTTDICKMYRQIRVLPEYRKYQHIIWRASPHDKLVEYELNTVNYGVNCAPFLALRTLRAIASEDCAEAELVRQALTQQTYVDDICVGADDIDGALRLQSNLISILVKSGLELKKWSSNSPAIFKRRSGGYPRKPSVAV